MKVKDIMTKDIVYINPNATVTEAAQLMQKHNIGSVPVCEQNKLIGIVTDRDIVVRNIANGMNPNNTKVRDVMTSQVASATPDMDVSDAASIMSQKQIRRMPVIESNNLVGIVSLGDMATNPYTDTEASHALSEISFPSKPV